MMFGVATVTEEKRPRILVLGELPVWSNGYDESLVKIKSGFDSPFRLVCLIVKCIKCGTPTSGSKSNPAEGPQELGARIVWLATQAVSDYDLMCADCILDSPSI